MNGFVNRSRFPLWSYIAAVCGGNFTLKIFNSVKGSVICRFFIKVLSTHFCVLYKLCKACVIYLSLHILICVPSTEQVMK